LITDEKMGHIVHLMIDGIAKAKMIEFVDEGLALREAKKVANQYLQQLNSVADIAANRIRSQKNPPRENSPQWDTLYQKYYEEEMRKKGG
jgi:uncharacterized protein